MMQRHAKPQHASRRHQRKGVSMVEMALIAPVFLMIFFAGLEFARICMIRNAANNAAYQAARQIVVPGATVQTAYDEAGRILTVMGVQTYSVVVTPSVITNATERVTVRINIPAKDNGWISALFVKNLTVNAGSTLFTERDTAY